MIEAAAGFGNLIPELLGIWAPHARSLGVRVIEAIARWWLRRYSWL